MGTRKLDSGDGRVIWHLLAYVLLQDSEGRGATSMHEWKYGTDPNDCF